MDGLLFFPLIHYFIKEKMHLNGLNEKGILTSLGEIKHTVHDN